MDEAEKTLLLAVARCMAHQYPSLQEHIDAVDPPEEEPGEGEGEAAEAEQPQRIASSRKRK